MGEYSFIPTAEPSSSGTVTSVYASADRVGDTLTLVIAGYFTRKGSIADYSGFALGNFVLPSDVWSKLLPYSSSWLVSRDVELTENYQKIIKTPALVVKNSDNRVAVNLYNLGTNTALNTAYYFRVVNTFLLGKNLAP